MNKNKLLFPSRTFNYQGKFKGLTVVVAGGIHGDELTGIIVAKKLQSFFDKKKLTVNAGRLIIITEGNPKAVLRGKRGSKSGADLNRCFRNDFLDNKKITGYEIRRARELATILKGTDVLLDLHSTRKPSDPFITWGGAGLNKKRRDICKWFAAKRILLDQNLIYTGPKGGCADDFVNRHGGIGICYETGLASDTTWSEAVFEEIINALRFLKILAGDTSGGVRAKAKQVFRFKEAIILGSNGFAYAPGLGTHSFQSVKKGGILGYRGVKPVIAKSNCVIVFPKTKDLWQVGKEVGYLAVLTKS